MLDMTALLDRRTEGFSQGERMKTALARALVHDPANIVLDEPTNGLDVLATRALRETLRYLRTPEGGAKCIVFSTHIMQEVERLCDSVVVVSHGRTVAARHACRELLAADRAERLRAGLRDAGRSPRGGRMKALAVAWAVFRKELVDALRDRRTLMVVLISAVLLGPMVLIALVEPARLVRGAGRAARGGGRWASSTRRA